MAEPYPIYTVGSSNLVEGANQTVNAKPTLSSAIGGIDDFNKRLLALRVKAYEIDEIINGSDMKVSGDATNPPTIGNSAIARLHGGIGDAHVVVSELEKILGAIRRSLG